MKRVAMPRQVNVQELNAPNSSTSGIQEAIDALPAEGGSVFLPAGEYRLRRRVRLRSNLRLHGEGAATRITRPAVKYWELEKTVKERELRVVLRTTKGLREGDEVFLGSIEWHGWHSTHALVRSLQAKRFEMEFLANSQGRQMGIDKFPLVSNWFPALNLEGIADVTVENLTIDGGIKVQRRPKTDFTVAGLHATHCRGLRLFNLTVRNWPGDGISVQGGTDVLVRACSVENCCGQGLHPGSGVKNSSWVENLSRGNTKDGFFFCMAVTQAICQGNLLYGNRRHGIGGLGHPDAFNVVANNVCAFNQQHGIEAPKAVGNTVVGNLCRNNSQEKAGKYPAILFSGHRDNVVKNNLCLDDQESHTQTDGVVSLEPAGENLISDNPCFFSPPPVRR